MLKLGSNQRRNHKAPQVGQRVELPVFSDQWMRGARFGVVRSVVLTEGDPDATILEVKCDHPQIRRLYRHFAENFRFV